MTTILTERQKREEEFYNQYCNRAPEKIDFTPVDSYLAGQEKRPWNSYWFVYQLLVDYYQEMINQGPLKLLDFGCGPGGNALRCGRIGYEVEGFDISRSNIKLAEESAQQYKMEDKVHFQVGPAEKLNYPDHFFDVIVGIDILHHVDIPQAIRECHRILKKQGIAIFREPLEAPLFDNIRHHPFVTKLFPTSASLERHVTADERKLSKEDLSTIENIFPKLKLEKSFYLSRLDRWIYPLNYPKSSLTEKLDFAIIRHLPFISHLAGAGVIILKKGP
ncbi:MAG: class I SAM-dependent methyltransferase [Pseudomonadota bacterium]